MPDSFIRFVRQPARWALPAAMAAAGLLAAGCVVTPLPGPGVAYEQGPAVVSPMAPPAPYQETVTVAPSPISIWIGGFWEWGGGRYAWRPGHWATPPRAGYSWVPHHWEQGPGGWHSRGGYWRGR
ncbi:MAG TPA: hypothetical protein VGC24_08725 [Burkholderiaceae bacterium]